MELGFDAISVDVLELKLSDSILGFMVLGLYAVLEFMPTESSAVCRLRLMLFEADNILGLMSFWI